MEGNRRISGPVLKQIIFWASALTVTGCIFTEKEKTAVRNSTDVEIALCTEGFKTKAIDPDEELITDISLMIFDSEGDLDQHFWIQDCNSSWPTELTATLVRGKRYTFCACANFGTPVKASTIDALKDIRYYLTYPDEYSRGMPMYAFMHNVKIGPEARIELELRHLMAKISIRLDRSRLDKDIDMRVMSVKIGNCPKQTSVFMENMIKGPDECFVLGFNRQEGECSVLNTMDRNGKSGALSLYMLENMQGSFSDHEIEDHEKVFLDNDPRKHTCSYIEIELSYMSDKAFTYDRNLIYRFYLGEDATNLDIERNSHYSITVRPENDGLSGDGWRVDKSGLIPAGEPYIYQYPSSYIRGDIGDTVHIGCRLFPPYTPFDVGVRYMEADKITGIYDYKIDEDGHGAVLTLTGPGMGLIYMEAGPPVNDAALFVIEVNLPS